MKKNREKEDKIGKIEKFDKNESDKIDRKERKTEKISSSVRIDHIRKFKNSHATENEFMEIKMSVKWIRLTGKKGKQRK